MITKYIALARAFMADMLCLIEMLFNMKRDSKIFSLAFIKSKRESAKKSKANQHQRKFKC